MVARSLQAFAVGQISRLSGLEFYTALGKAGILELARVMADVALGDYHIEAAITKVVEEWQKVPTPSEMRRVLADLRPVFQRDASSPSCDICDGLGLYSVYGVYRPMVRRSWREYPRLRDHAGRLMSWIAYERACVAEFEQLGAGMALTTASVPCACPAGQAKKDYIRGTA